MASYTYDDVAGDVNLTHFSIDHDLAEIIPLIYRAQNTSGRPLKILGSPWSPPGWMKANGHAICGNIPCSQCILLQNYSDAWATYISKFVSAYKSHNISIWAVTPQVKR